MLHKSPLKPKTGLNGPPVGRKRGPLPRRVLEVIDSAYPRSSASISGRARPTHDPTQLNYFQIPRTLRPVVTPADDQVAACWRMFVDTEVFALILKLHADALPLARLQFAHGFAVGEVDLEALYLEAHLSGDQAEKKDYAGLVDRLIRQAGDEHGRAEDWAFGEDGAAAAQIISGGSCRRAFGCRFVDRRDALLDHGQGVAPGLLKVRATFLQPVAAEVWGALPCY